MSKQFKVEVVVETDDHEVIFSVIENLVQSLDEADRVFKLKQIAAREVE